MKTTRIAVLYVHTCTKLLWCKKNVNFENKNHVNKYRLFSNKKRINNFRLIRTTLCLKDWHENMQRLQSTWYQLNWKETEFNQMKKSEWIVSIWKFSSGEANKSNFSQKKPSEKIVSIWNFPLCEVIRKYFISPQLWFLQ